MRVRSVNRRLRGRPRRRPDCHRPLCLRSSRHFPPHPRCPRLSRPHGTRVPTRRRRPYRPVGPSRRRSPRGGAATGRGVGPAADRRRRSRRGGESARRPTRSVGSGMMYWPKTTSGSGNCPTMPSSNIVRVSSRFPPPAGTRRGRRRATHPEARQASVPSPSWCALRGAPRPRAGRNRSSARRCHAARPGRCTPRPQRPCRLPPGSPWSRPRSSPPRTPAAISTRRLSTGMASTGTAPRMVAGRVAPPGCRDAGGAGKHERPDGKHRRGVARRVGGPGVGACAGLRWPGRRSGVTKPAPNDRCPPRRGSKGPGRG